MYDLINLTAALTIKGGGITTTGALTIESGAVTIQTKNPCIYADGSVAINGGYIKLHSEDASALYSKSAFAMNAGYLYAETIHYGTIGSTK